MPSLSYPKKRLGQNFLCNKHLAARIVESLHLETNDTVIEIGPGKGILTDALREGDCKLKIAVEIDPELTADLKKVFSPEITILQQDILSLSFEKIYEESKIPVKIVGNIPYNITSPIIFHILDNSSYISQAILMVQKEVADRLTASKDSKAYGILTVMVNSQSDVEKLFNVSRNNFYPKPRVDSSVVRLTLIQNKMKTEVDFNRDLFKTIVHGTFNNRRKMLKNSLKKIISEEDLKLINSVPLTCRPENLSLEDFRNLTMEIGQLLDAAQ